MSHDGGQELLNEESQEYAAYSRQHEVVNEEKRLELQRLPVAHELAAAEDYGVVGDY